MLFKSRASMQARAALLRCSHQHAQCQDDDSKPQANGSKPAPTGWKRRARVGTHRRVGQNASRSQAVTFCVRGIKQPASHSAARWRHVAEGQPPQRAR